MTTLNLSVFLKPAQVRWVRYFAWTASSESRFICKDKIFVQALPVPLEVNVLVENQLDKQVKNSIETGKKKESKK